MRASPHRTNTAPKLGDTRRGTILMLFAFGCAWAGFVAIAPLLPESILAAAWLCNGFAAAFYLTPLYWIRGGPRNQAKASLLFVFSCAHILWLLISGIILAAIVPAFHVDEDTTLLTITSIGYAIALGGASRSFTPFFVMTFTGLIVGFIPLSPNGYPTGLDRLVFGIPMLHVAMVSAIAYETWNRPDITAQNTCPTCGYSRLGLPVGNVCPECGNA